MLRYGFGCGHRCMHTHIHSHTHAGTEELLSHFVRTERKHRHLTVSHNIVPHSCPTHVVVYSNVNDSDRKVQDKWKQSDQICANTHERRQITLRVNQLHINNARNIPDCTIQQKSIKLLWCFHPTWHRSNNDHCCPLWCNTACMLIYWWRTLFLWHLWCAQSCKQ